MKLTRLFTALLLFMLSFGALAQTPSDSLFRRRGTEQPKPNWMERISLGGNFGASFGNSTFINLAPLVAYRFTDKFMAGGGFTYIYSRWKFPGYQAVSNSIYGGRTMARYSLFPNFAPTLEYEALNVPYLKQTDFGVEQDRRWIGNPLVGATVLFPIGRRSNFGITGLYNLNYENNRMYSPYGSPWVIRMGFML
jgi:hypothetical protein